MDVRASSAKNLVAAYSNWLSEKADLLPQAERHRWLSYLEHHKERFADVLSLLPPAESCGPILEVGSSPGHLSLILSDMGYDLTCIDANVARFAGLWESAGINIAQVDIETQRLPFDDGRFQIVLFTEILEHLRINPFFALSEVYRVTRPAGQLILSIPNITPRDRWRFLCGRDYQGNIIEEFEKLEKFGYMGHIRLYSAREADMILRHIGYESLCCLRRGRLKGSGLWRLLKYFWGDRFRNTVYFVAERPAMSNVREVVTGSRYTNTL
jgi:SAM-dependent methyltransferase